MKSVLAILTVTAAMMASAAALTAAQKARANLAPEELKMIRVELANLHSANRWAQAQQDRYLTTCEKQKAKDPSINRRFCECSLEVVMDRFATAGDYAMHLVDGGKPDEQMAGMTGMCLVAYGT